MADLGTWSSIVEIREQEEEFGREEGWNMEMRAIDKGGWKKEMDKRI